ncbi:DUF1097 domain-containing protein [Serratia odorifera]|uniref:Glutathione-regulated potassium-efflux system protein n=1 Tax=Serratia odorifera DSM 4582 TaxID=667129 RepID=D4E3R1_SEROD|nr:DUF1097 domain-containing protein [Serratia odorifera]EFE95609.1 hypothetical protein HMPREF0758_2811 [Serratia odorifera DSM 4582]PNK90233.1 DUF1097 domain-containing protein [Serratia odorifera]RII71327.1 DUF1097 domain-containing protein [Serratia odorifera]HEJ9094516.1 DUF1097 domain-containing protein [Serratia odorifera]
MNVIFAIAVTTGILSGIWGWVAVSLGLIGWAGFLGCTAYFACPQGGLKGLAICALTCCSGVFWAMAIIHGSALDPAWSLLGYALTGVVAFLMCIQAYQQWLGFVPGTFIGACATFAGDGNWRWVTLSLLVGLVFGYAMKNSGLWLAARGRQRAASTPTALGENGGDR